MIHEPLSHVVFVTTPHDVRMLHFRGTREDALLKTARLCDAREIQRVRVDVR